MKNERLKGWKAVCFPLLPVFHYSIVFILSFVICHYSFSQSVSPQLIGSTGNYSTAGFGSISSSVGEPVVTTVSSGTLTLTQGFQQTFANVSISSIIPLPNDTICMGDNTTLVTTVTGTPAFTFNWSPSAGLSCTTCQNPVASPTVTTNYTVTVTDAQPTTATETITITVLDPVVSISVTPDDSICDGDNVTLTASTVGGFAPYSYVWGPGGEMTSSIVVSPSSSTAYVAVSTDKFGCSASATQSITVIPIPTPSITAAPGLSICNGESATLSASGGNSYVWNTGETTSSIIVSPTASSGYTVTATSAGCSSTTSVFITVMPTPVATASSPATICSGQAATLTVSVSGGSAPYAYAWAAGGETTSSITVTPTAFTSYTVTVSGSNGCSDSDITSVTVNPLPSAVTGPNKTICPGSSTTIGGAAVGGNTYAWNPLPGLSSPTSANPTANPTVSTTYSLTETITATGCTNTNTVLVTVAPSPTVTLSGTLTICSGSSTTLSASVTGSAPFSYVWSAPGGTTSSLSVSPTASTGYTITVTDATTCSGTAAATVTVTPTPTVSISPASTTICNGSNTTLTASGASTYNWAPPTSLSNPSISNPVANPTSTITYTVTGTTSGCAGTKTVTVNVNQPPSASSAGPDQNICSPASTATITGNIPGVGTGLWSLVSGSASIISPTSATTGVTGLTVGPPAVLRWTISNAPCTSTFDDVSIFVNPTPSITVTPSPSFTICNGGSTTLTASSTASTYTWAPTTGLSNPNIANPVASPTSTLTYTVSGTGSGCTGTTTVTVTVNPVPTVTVVASNSPVCSGQSLSLSSGSNIGTSYSWNGPNSFTATVQNPTITIAGTAASGTYSVTASANGCTSTAGTTSVTVNPTPTTPTPAGSNSPLCEGQDLSLTAATVSGATYSWTGPNGFTASSEDPSISPATTAASGTYSVTAFFGSCSSPTATTSVTVDAAPTIATGSDLTVCGITATLTGNAPTVGSGLWSIIFSPSGTITTPSSPTSGVTGLSPGTHVFQWAISNGVCAPSTATVTITVNTPPAVSATAANETCFGSCNGSATVIPAGLTYLWDDPGTQTTQTASALCAGNYSVLVTDAAGCTSTATATVGSPAALSAALSSSNVLCNGGTTGSATATPSGGTSPYTYSWSNGQSASTATGLGQATYTLTLTDANSCTATFTVGITEPPALAMIPNPVGTSCSTSCDGSANANPSGGTFPYSFLWNDPGTQTTQSATGLCAGSYSVTLTDNNACVLTTTVTIIPGPVLSPTVTANDSTLCSGDNALLTASGGTSYSWWDAGQTTASINIQPTVNTTYTVTVSSGTCSRADSIFILVYPSPTASVTATPASVCPGYSSTLAASGGTAYSWSTTATSSSIVITPTASATYTVIVGNSSGCTDTATIPVTMNNPPVASITGNTTICSGVTATLTASGTGTYLWNTGSTNAVITDTPAINTSYTVTVTDANGCSDTATVLVNVIATPTVSVSATATTLCAGGSVTLTATSNGANYSWSPGGQTTPVISETPTGSTSYVVTVSTGSCSKTDSLLVNVITVTAQVSGTTSVCVGDVITLGATGGISYSWNGPGGFTSGLQNPSLSPATTADAGTYTVTVTGGNSCSDTATITVSVNPVPVPVISAASTSVCFGSSASLTASGGSAYSWSPGGQTTAVITPMILNNVTYTVTAYNGSCSASTSILINVLALPSIGITSSDPDLTICPGDVDTLFGTGGIGYYWGTQFGTPPYIVVSPSVTTTYSVVGQGTNGCYNTASATVVLSGLTVNAGPDMTICPGFTAQLTAVVSGSTSGVSYLWTPSQFVNDSVIYNPSATPDSTMYFSVEVYNGDGCWSKDTVLVTVKVSVACVLHIYNGITPNGDNNNEVWWIDGIQSFPDNNVAIFNRWGSKVWSATGYDNKEVAWRGTNDLGESLPDGTYYYVIEIRTDDGVEAFSAWVEITH